MKTTLDLPDDLIREAKLRALIQGRTLRDLVADFLRQGLGRVPPVPSALPSPASMVKIGSNGLPVIRCRPHAKAGKASTASLQALLNLEQLAQTELDMQHAGRTV